jgi:two-component system heavy metal sensor histidine kinase CusS
MSRCRSITFRLTLLFAAAATAVLLVLGLLIGDAVEQHFVEQDRELLSGKSRLAAHLLAQARTPEAWRAVPGHIEELLIGHHDLTILLMDANGAHRFASPNAAFPEAVLKMPGNPAQVQQWFLNGRPWRGIVTDLPAGARDLPALRVAMAVDISHHEHFMASFRSTLWLFVVVAAALVGFLGWVAVRRALAPLQAMRREAAGVTAQRLDQRLDMERVPPELAGLARTLNEMLARLEESFQRLKDFSSDLAHELRTPVSNLMTETQVALAQARGVEEYREVLASNMEEYERLARMIGDMLFLAQAENGLMVPRREPVDLAAEVRELFDFFDALAEEKALHLSLDGSGQVLGDKLMLRRALANLLANAIRHTPTGGSIRVSIHPDGHGTTLAVENSGKPISEEHLSRIFDRFYSVDPSRHGGEGAGLGLAITRSIVRAHGGEIDARNTKDGVCLEIRLG